MRFEIDAKEFRAALKVVGCCLVKKSNFPAASHVLLDATKGELSLSAIKMLMSLDIPEGLFIDENRMVFYGHGYRFSTRLIDKKYPDAAPIFTETPGQDIDLDDGDVEEIEGVIEKAVIVFDTTGLMLSCAGQEIRVHIQGQLGFYTDYLRLNSVVQNFNLYINPVYLRDALRGCGLKSVLHIPAAADKPILIKACGAVHAIMPMREG